MTLLNPGRRSCVRRGEEKKRGEEEEALCCLPLKPQEAEDERVKVSNCQNIILKVIFQAQSSPQCHLSSSKVGTEGTIKRRIFWRDRAANTKTEEVLVPKQPASHPLLLGDLCSSDVPVLGDHSQLPSQAAQVSWMWWASLFPAFLRARITKKAHQFTSYAFNLNQTPDFQFYPLLMIIIIIIINFLALPEITRRRWWMCRRKGALRYSPPCPDPAKLFLQAPPSSLLPSKKSELRSSMHSAESSARDLTPKSELASCSTFFADLYSNCTPLCL